MPGPHKMLIFGRWKLRILKINTACGNIQYLILNYLIIYQPVHFPEPSSAVLRRSVGGVRAYDMKKASEEQVTFVAVPQSRVRDLDDEKKMRLIK